MAIPSKRSNFEKIKNCGDVKNHILMCIFDVSLISIHYETKTLGPAASYFKRRNAGAACSGIYH